VLEEFFWVWSGRGREDDEEDEEEVASSGTSWPKVSRCLLLAAAGPPTKLVVGWLPLLFPQLLYPDAAQPLPLPFISPMLWPLAKLMLLLLLSLVLKLVS